MALGKLTSLGNETVYINDFNRAQTDVSMYESILSAGSIGKLYNQQTFTQINNSSQYQVVRMNCDTLYSYAVFDLSLEGVIIELPANDGPYMSLYVIDQDQYSLSVDYPDKRKNLSIAFEYRSKSKGKRDKKVSSPTRYIFALIRTLANPNNASDLDRAHALQNAVKITQNKTGVFAIPKWNVATLTEVQTVIADLESYLAPNTRVLGYRGKITETAHLVGSATGWGGLPLQYADYELIDPSSSGSFNSSAVYAITVTSVPILEGGFWSVTVYNESGYLEYNTYGSYSLNILSAQAETNGSYVIYFSATKADYMTNWLYIYSGWNYMVRLYKPSLSIIDGKWKFPTLTQVV